MKIALTTSNFRKGMTISRSSVFVTLECTCKRRNDKVVLDNKVYLAIFHSSVFL